MVAGHHLQVTEQCDPLTDFAMLPAHRFWRETVFIVKCHVTSK